MLLTDNDPFCCAVLRARVADGRLFGTVLEKDVRELTGDDLRPFRQVHLFAGIGGFALAQIWSGWPEDWSLITGGPPCQPFSSAARGRVVGTADNRYLWPEMLAILREFRADHVLFENVVNIDRLAIEEVVTDLEESGYEVAPPLEIPACAVGQDHWRPRIWIYGYADGQGQSRMSVDAQMARMREHRHERKQSARTNGLSGKLARNSAIGNAIVPQIAVEIMRAVIKSMR